MIVRIGTRASPLARWQAQWVAERLAGLDGLATELVPISTSGDRQRGPIAHLGTTGVFTKELERALLDGRIDLAVHSLKDLPTDAVPGLSLAAVPVRQSPADVLVSRGGVRLAELPPGAVVATGSLRRRSQLLHARPDLRLADLRGNIDTRLGRLAAGDFSALVLAEAGLRRLGLADQISEIFSPEVMLPAVGQGALGLETRTGDAPLRKLLAALDDRPTHAAVLAERALLAALRGGCSAPIGAWARPGPEGRLVLDAAVLSLDGRRRLAESAAAAPASEPLAGAVELGAQVAGALLAAGAGELIAEARQSR